MKVLVTGGHGFIGQHVMAVLAREGIEAVSFDLSHGQDVRSPGQVHLATEGCSHVIHLAGMLGTSELFATAHSAVDVNVHGTLNVLQACAATGAAYTGITMPRVWSNVYQATKQCAQALASAWHQHEGVPVSHVRAFNAYGVGQKLYPVQKIIPTFSHRAWCGEPIPIWGDGTQQVDLVWAGDIAEMLLRATSYGDDQVFDGGTGTGLTVNEVARHVCDRTGSKAGVQYLPMRKGEHEAKVVASGEGWNLMGFTPHGVNWVRLDEAVDSYREH
jgi:nucleoside-diphosphate-sugar epimerase